MSAPLIREKVLTEYKDVFNCLGHIGDSSSFTIDPNYPLVQHVLRYIPVTLQKEVKEKIAELERKGIIQKVAESTSWISSMVVLEMTTVYIIKFFKEQFSCYSRPDVLVTNTAISEYFQGMGV